MAKERAQKVLTWTPPAGKKKYYNGPAISPSFNRSDQGEVKHGILQFLGIEFAVLENRLAEASLKTEYGPEVLDATRLGPQVMSIPNGCTIEHGLIQKELAYDGGEHSDLHSLNLNITVPEQRQKVLPVFVYIHGGGFAIGSNSWPQFNQARLVKLGIDQGIPTIGVAINYRLGIPGFLTSSELRENGFKGNNGIRDQVTALSWVQRHIAGFGGDPNNVTVIGQSAGAMASMLHLQSAEPLFHQLISMSGTPLCLALLEPQDCEAAYSRVIECLNLGDQSPKSRVDALLTMPASTIFESLPPDIPLVPSVDGDVILSNPSFKHLFNTPETLLKALPGATRCRRIMIGSCTLDTHVYSNFLSSRESEILHRYNSLLEKALDGFPAEVAKLQQAYGLGDDISDDVAVRNILRFGSDISFYVPSVEYARIWPGDAFLYDFNEGNPWSGPFKGEATHILDVAYLFQNYREWLPASANDVAVRFATDLLKFVAGQSPFPSFDGQQGSSSMVYGSTSGERWSDDGERRKVLFEVGQKCGFDDLVKVFRNLVSGHYD